MTAAKAPALRRNPNTAEFARMGNTARLHLCQGAEDSDVRARHIAALLAFTPTVLRSGNRMQITFEHGPTARWVAESLSHRDVVLTEARSAGGVVEVVNPQIVLGRHGFREGRWVFGQGMAAALGISCGAVHAAVTFNHQGMKVACPNPTMMLTLTAAMTRLGIEVRPMEGKPRAAVSPGDVPDALRRLGIAETAKTYQRIHAQGAA